MKKTADPRSALAGIRVVDLTQALAGPFCTMMLGDLGADVVKVERPGVGDQSRGWGPPFVEGESAYFLSANRNKRSLTLDFGQPAGREIIHKLLATADVFITNIPRWESLAKYGIDYDSLREPLPQLIYCIISGFGMTGPYAGRSGYDLVAQAMAGTMSLTGELGGEPMRFPTPLADMSAGLYSVIGILSAMRVRDETGTGQLVDISLLESQMNWLTNVAGTHFATGREPARTGNLHPTITPYQPIRTRTGYLILAVGTERLWNRLCQVLEIEDTVGEDPRFVTNRERNAHREELVAVLSDLFAAEATETWLPKLQSAGIPCGPISSVGEAFANEQLLARGGVVEQDHNLVGAVRSIGNPVHLSGSPPAYQKPPPTLGQHTMEILQELGYDSETVDEFREQKVV